MLRECFPQQGAVPLSKLDQDMVWHTVSNACDKILAQSKEIWVHYKHGELSFLIGSVPGAGRALRGVLVPKRRYKRREPTNDRQQIHPLLKDTAQINYEIIRRVVLWGQTPKERGAQIGEYIQRRCIRVIHRLSTKIVTWWKLKFFTKTPWMIVITITLIKSMCICTLYSTT